MCAWSPAAAGEERGLPKPIPKPLGGSLALERGNGVRGGAATCQLAVPSGGAARLGFCHVFVYLVWLM